MPKSLTTSTAMFLSMYNYKTMHWIGSELNLENLEQNSTNFFLNFAKNYEVCSDNPYHLLFKELDAKYKNSKFIYINRNKKDWVRSCLKHVKITGLEYFESTKYENFKFFKELADKYDFESLIKKYEIHNSKVLEYFNNKDNFLYLQADDGKKENKICEFLNINLDPKIKFPVANVSGTKHGPR